MAVTVTGQIDRTKGAVGTIVRPTIIGTRPNPYVKGQSNGEEVYRAASGHRYSDLLVKNIGNGLVRVGAPVDGLVVENIEAYNVYRIIENTVSGSNTDASLTNFVLRNIKVKGIERALSRIRYNSSNGLIEHCEADGDLMADEPFPVGFHLDGTAHDIVYQDTIARNLQMPSVPGVYRQGDGFCDETNNYNITYRRTQAFRCADGGYDLKSKNVLLDDVYAENNHKNYRLWANGRATKLTSVNPWSGHVGFYRAGAEFVFEHLVIRSTNKSPIFILQAGGAKITVKSYDIQVPAGTPLLKIEASGNVIDWGPQGTPKL